MLFVPIRNGYHYLRLVFTASILLRSREMKELHVISTYRLCASLVVALFLAAGSNAHAVGNFYQQHNLVADLASAADHTDSSLVNHGASFWTGQEKVTCCLSESAGIAAPGHCPHCAGQWRLAYADRDFHPVDMLPLWAHESRYLRNFKY